MKNKLIAAALCAAVLPLSAFAQHAASKAEATSAQQAHGKSDGGSAQMHQSMMQGMKEMQSMKISGDMDRDFAMMMRKHHQDGVKMAQMEVDKGKDGKMQEMARKIIEDQKKDIAEFDKYLAGKK